MSDTIATAPAYSRGGSGGGAPPDQAPTPDPHLGLRFWVQLGSIEIAGFKECSGLKIETEIQEYPEGGLNTYTHKLPVRAKYGNITLKRGLDEGQDLYRWYMDCIRRTVRREEISIIVYDYLGKEKQRWELHEAFPCKWTGPDLKADQGAMAVETVEIAHHGLLPIPTKGRGQN